MGRLERVTLTCAALDMTIKPSGQPSICADAVNHNQNISYFAFGFGRGKHVKNIFDTFRLQG